MKAVKATQDLINKNPIFFSGVVVDSIVRKQIPNKFNGEENINGGGYKDRPDLHLLDGWKDIVIPTYNTANQKLGELILDGNNYSYEVIDLSQQEIDDLLDETEENQAREKIDNYRFRGGEIVEKTRTKMWRRIHLYPDSPMGLTKQQMAKVERWLSDVYFNLLTGNFRQAKNDIISMIEQRDDVTGDSSLLEAAGMLDTATWLRGQIEDYFDNNYDL